VGSGLTNQHLTRLEKLARGKHSSLLQKFVKYGRKNFITLGPEDIGRTIVYCAV